MSSSEVQHPPRWFAEHKNEDIQKFLVSYATFRARGQDSSELIRSAIQVADELSNLQPAVLDVQGYTKTERGTVNAILTNANQPGWLLAHEDMLEITFPLSGATAGTRKLGGKRESATYDRFQKGTGARLLEENKLSAYVGEFGYNVYPEVKTPAPLINPISGPEFFYICDATRAKVKRDHGADHWDKTLCDAIGNHLNENLFPKKPPRGLKSDGSYATKGEDRCFAKSLAWNLSNGRKTVNVRSIPPRIHA